VREPREVVSDSLTSAFRAPKDCDDVLDTGVAADLSAVTVLFTVDPAYDGITLRYTFATEESVWLGATDWDDAFTATLATDVGAGFGPGQHVALEPLTREPIHVFWNALDPVFASAVPAEGMVYDTVLPRATHHVPLATGPGAVHRLRLEVCDSGDGHIDSAAFLAPIEGCAGCVDSFASCGDGALTADEACDDGNTAWNDGCSPGCAPETDLDADGWSDGYEQHVAGTDPADPDSDADGLADADEPITDPLDPDTDDDGIVDGADPCPLGDDRDADGACDADDRCGGADDAVDTDLDGEPDACEPPMWAAPVHLWSNAGTVGLLEAVDLGGDGDLDVVAASVGEIRWIPGSGGGLFGASVPLAHSGGPPTALATGDLDGDGDADLVLGTNGALAGDTDLAWFPSDAAGLGAEVVLETAADSVHGVAAADVDADGDVDVVASFQADDSVRVYENLGAGAFAAGVVLSTDLEAYSVDLADLDGDGHVEIVCGSTVGAVVYRGLGGGAFLPWRAIPVDYWGGTPNDVRVEDVDQDGLPDLTYASSGVSVRYNLGGFAFADALRFADDSQWTAPRFADLGGDGHLEPVSAWYYGSDIAWFLNHGATAGAEYPVSSVAPAPVALAVGDLDGDGDTDVLAATATAGGGRVSWTANLGRDLDGDGLAD
jgi:cysteine-rich repeat protein